MPKMKFPEMDIKSGTRLTSKYYYNKNIYKETKFKKIFYFGIKLFFIKFKMESYFRIKQLRYIQFDFLWLKNQAANNLGEVFKRNISQN